MKQAIIAWCDAHLIDGWRGAQRLWSNRVAIFWTVVGVVFALLALISDEVKGLIGWVGFSALFVVAGVSFGVARLLKQPGANDD
ncbi:MAG: hypothetical protein QM651_07985 [Rhodoblastus sp.]